MQKHILSPVWKSILICSLLALPLGAVIGAIDALFGRVLLWITAFRGEHVWVLLPFLALAGLLIVFCYQRFGKGTQNGMGMVFSTAHGEQKDIPLRLVPFVMLSTWLGHLFGASAGREGVAVQIGASLSHWVGKRLPQPECARTLLIAGMAAGFAGLFGTPLAATFFALEVLTVGRLEYRSLLPAFLGSFAASITASLLGLEKFTVSLSCGCDFSLPLLPKLLLLGVCFGLAGLLFSVLLKQGKGLLARLFPNPLLRVAVAGVFLSAILLLLHGGRYAGLGTNLIQGSLQGGTVFGYDWILKILLTVLTLSAGFQGGEVTPLFAIGASLGAVVASFLGLPVELCAALGYAAVFGSATNTLLAPVLIGAEVFGGAYIPHFFVVCVIAFLCNGNRSIYGGQRVLHFQTETAAHMNGRM